MFGEIAGGSGSTRMEAYQRAKVAEGTGHPCSKTRMRINWREKKLVAVAQPNRLDNGYDLTEDFDGLQELDAAGARVYINFKCIADAGGSQTRSLREVYHYVEAQLEVLLTSGEANGPRILFANILDGDAAAKALRHFAYLLSLPAYSSVRNYVYVGDLRGYFDWLKARVAVQ